MAIMADPFPAAARSSWSRRIGGPIVAQEAFGRVEALGEGLWAFISTPLGGDYTTVSNGGIIAGRDGVLVVEAFQTADGARWMAEKARELTGRWPTHVLVTHYHGDHSGGAEGFLDPGTEQASGGEAPAAIHVTETSRDASAGRLSQESPERLRLMWADAVLVDEAEPSTVDLGGRSIRLVPRNGHTASDVTVELPEEGITWCGDLVWNGMFPNYMDARPTQLSRAVRQVQADGRRAYVPGHGPMADAEDIARYLTVIDGLEETARRARKEGWTPQEAGERHSIPQGLGEWTLFNPAYFQRAVEAWYKEWAAGG
jgi:glyoxylase-like metal-dependent hydrolase (beta-lactamase superfamily II)